jgi:hypothetical protein
MCVSFSSGQFRPLWKEMKAFFASWWTSIPCLSNDQMEAFCHSKTATILTGSPPLYSHFISMNFVDFLNADVSHGRVTFLAFG